MIAVQKKSGLKKKVNGAVTTSNQDANLRQEASNLFLTTIYSIVIHVKYGRKKRVHGAVITKVQDANKQKKKRQKKRQKTQRRLQKQKENKNVVLYSMPRKHLQHVIYQPKNWKPGLLKKHWKRKSVILLLKKITNVPIQQQQRQDQS